MKKIKVELVDMDKTRGSNYGCYMSTYIAKQHIITRQNMALP